ncbi:MAG: Gfo/Idh/MocA family oxidoreductase [Candidatus Woesearchaeota archaeon]
MKQGNSASVIGAGGIGYYHLQKLLNLQKELTVPFSRISIFRTSSDNVANTCAKIQKEFQGTTMIGYSNLYELIRKEQPSHAIIATPTCSHYHVFHALFSEDPDLERVLMEKPSTTYKEGSKELVEIARQRNLVYGVNLQLASLHLSSNQDVVSCVVGSTLAQLMSSMTYFKCVWESAGTVSIGQPSDILFDLGIHALSLLDYHLIKDYQVLEARQIKEGMHFKIDFVKFTGEFDLNYRADKASCRRNFVITEGDNHKFSFGGLRHDDGKYYPSMTYNRCGGKPARIMFKEDFSLTSIRNILMAEPIVSGLRELRYIEILEAVKQKTI